MQDYTDHGLEKTYRRLFEKAGWMLVALKENRLDDVQSYLRRLTELAEEVEVRRSETTNEEKATNYQRMHKNLSKLDGMFSLLIQYMAASPSSPPMRRGAQYMAATKYYANKDAAKKDQKKNVKLFQKW